MIEAVTIGETMVSLRARGLIRLGGEFRSSIAGAESTVAIGLSRLGHRVSWIGRVGADEPGELVLRTLRAEGVDVSAVIRDEAAPTGLMLVEQRLPGRSRVQYYRANSAGSRLSSDDVRSALPPRARLLHLSGITPALGEQPRAAVRAALDHARSSGWTVSLDVNFRARLWSETEAGRVLGPIAARADVVIGSAEELALLSDGDLLDTEVREVVTKLGEHGASSRTAQGEWTAPAHPVAVVDPIGAGDAFTAGYLSALLAGLPTPARLARGNAAGACAVATSGDWEGLPTAAELDLLALADGEVLR